MDLTKYGSAAYIDANGKSHPHWTSGSIKSILKEATLNRRSEIIKSKLSNILAITENLAEIGIYDQSAEHATFILFNDSGHRQVMMSNTWSFISPAITTNNNTGIADIIYGIYN